MSEIPQHAILVRMNGCEVMFSRTNVYLSGQGPSSLYRASTWQPSYSSARPAEAGRACEGWWSQTGSNRRPHACKARALPAELWPRNQKTNARIKSIVETKVLSCPSSPYKASPGTLRFTLERGCATQSRRRSVVGLGRLELPTSRLSSARSNQLSYKPLTRGASKCAQPDESARYRTSAEPLARVRPRRKRNEDGEIPPMELNNPEIAGP
jgi:hypothetical protein